MSRESRGRLARGAQIATAPLPTYKRGQRESDASGCNEAQPDTNQELTLRNAVRLWHASGLSGLEKRFVAPQRMTVLPDVPLKGKIDLEARVASVDPAYTTKGMYLADLVARLETQHIDDVWPKLQAPPRHQKYQPFLDYPFADALRWLHAVARVRYPKASSLEGLRQLGRDTVKVFVASHAGQVVRSMTMGPHDALLRMPAMWKVTDPIHTVIASAPRPHEVHFEVHGFPGWLDCGLIGTLEQVVISRKATPEIEVTLFGPEHGELTVRYRQ